MSSNDVRSESSLPVKKKSKLGFDTSQLGKLDGMSSPSSKSSRTNSTRSTSSSKRGSSFAGANAKVTPSADRKKSVSSNVAATAGTSGPTLKPQSAFRQVWTWVMVIYLIHLYDSKCSSVFILDSK